MAKAKKKQLSLEELLDQVLVKEEDRPYEVPGNWVWTKFNYIKKDQESFFDGDWILKENMDANGSVRLIQLSDIGVGEFLDKSSKYISNESFANLKCTQLQVNDLLISRMAEPIARSCILPEFSYKCITAVDVAVMRLNISLVLVKYINYLCNTSWFTDTAYSLARGTTRVRITRKNLGEIPVPIPPISEQQRIVSVIESLFVKLDTAKELAQNALDSFENRKAAILHKAFTGELTAKWREENKTNRNNVLTEVLTYYTESGVKKNINNILKYQESIVEINNIENSLWYKCSIGAIGVVSNGSTPSRQNLDFWNGGISWVSSGEVRNNIIETTKERISQVGYDNSSVKMLPAGTVLIAMIGEGKTRGQSAILNIEATINQNIAAIDLNHKKVESKFMWYWLQKQYVSNREKGNGTGPQALNCERVRELDFVLPPLAEQKEIVRILDNLLNNEQRAKELCDVIKKIDLMKKAILARAFRGELGTNNPEEESAVELLKEVLKEKI